MSRYVRPLLSFALLVLLRATGFPQTTRIARITQPVNEAQLRFLPSNTHPLARSEFDQGLAPSDLPLDRMLLVLSRSAAQQTELDSFLQNQQNPQSPQFHQWLTPQQFGQRFGAADADLAKITAWLQANGFQLGRVSNGRNVVEFSGTAAQVRQAFHTEIHKYLVNGETHWANSSDPQIPAALAPVVAGVSTLYSFRKHSQISALQANVAKVGAPGSRPQFTGSNGQHALAPNDLATIYNIAPVYGAGIKGDGTTIAVVARTNINTQDIQDFRTAFALPVNLPQILINGTNPGNLGSSEEAEAVLDASWAGALAPDATVQLVVSASTNTTDGVDLSEEYIIDNNLADVMTESFGDCEANYTAAEAQFYSSLAGQAAAQGITYAVAAGDSGSAGCDDPNSVITASGPLSVNLLAATPYNLAVGGTQFNDTATPSLYWNTANASDFSSAIQYIPETAWNESCTVAQCGRRDAGIWAGGGGASTMFSKPSWQSGVAGIPSDGARDVPDVSLTSANHDFYLLCLDGSCTTQHGTSYFSGISGTSAATPSFAGIMALVVQSTGSRQGQAAPTLYSLAAREDLSACNAALPPVSGNSCVFYDVTTGDNSVPGEASYGTSTPTYAANVGYDLATGLGSVNVLNLVKAWTGSGVNTPRLRTGIDSPSGGNYTVSGVANFYGWALADTGSVSTVNVAIDGMAFGAASYGAIRTDVCAKYSASNCPDVGWSFPFDTSVLAAGSHTLAVTVTTASGQVSTTSANFVVTNWTSWNPTKISIDSPNSQSQAFSGPAFFGGWAFNDISTISQVAVLIDGVSYGLAHYGGSRSDVCSAYPNKPGCSGIGWNFAVDSTTLADGPHTLTITPTSAGGLSASASATFQVANYASNPITLSIDQPTSQSAAFSGGAGFGGWAVGTSSPVSSVTVTIDGVSYGQAAYGANRTDVCTSHPGRPGCPNVGWNYFLDTTQLANGMHTLVITAYASSGQHTTANSTFLVGNPPATSPFSFGIDQPAAQNSIVLGPTTFRGWAINNFAAVSSLAVSIDGAAYGNATYGDSRSDVCVTYSSNPGCPNVGWSIDVDTTKLANGLHTLTLTAAAPSGDATLTGTISTTFTVANWTDNNPMKLSIDSPNSQSGTLSGSFGIGGWAIDQLAALDKISIAVDGASLGNAVYGAARADVCASFASAIGCPNVGWNYLLDTTLLSDGTHTLAVTGTTTGGQSSTFTASFQVANNKNNSILINTDNPAPGQTLTGVAPVAGWAVDTSGAQIVSVEILVDGALNGTAAYGESRPDVCGQFPTSGGCPGVGWNYQLDTAPFANGTHTLEVRAKSANGQQYTSGVLFGVVNVPIL